MGDETKMTLSNKDILSFDWKQEKLIYTKVLRTWGKTNNRNQFEMSIMLLSTFYRCFNILETFIVQKGLTNEFNGYIGNLKANYKDAFDKIHDLRKIIEKEFVPRFGV